MTKKTPIERTVTVKFTLPELAEALGFNKWLKTNEYLDADSHDDVSHSGYSAKDVSDFNEVIPNVNALFPREVAIALEDAERDAYAAAISTARHNAIKSSLENISNVTCDYDGVDSDGESLEVRGIIGEITDVTLDVPNCCAQVTMKNPEHLLNCAIDSMGYFYPTEIAADVALDEASLKRYFIAQINGYFEAYGFTKDGDELDRRFSPDINDEFFKSEIKYRVGELSIREVAEAVIDAIECGRMKDVEEAIKSSAELSQNDEKEIRQALKEVAKEKIDLLSEKMQKYA